MVRVPYLEQQDLAAEDHAILQRPIALYKALANTPKGVRAFLALADFIRFESVLDPRLRELAILEVGYLTRSPYEWSHHVKIGIDIGVTAEDIKGLMDEADGRPNKLDHETRLVLRAAREMTDGHVISDETFAELRSRLDAKAITELVMTVGFYNGVIKILATLEIEVEEEYMIYLEQFPLPGASAN